MSAEDSAFHTAFTFRIVGAFRIVEHTQGIKRVTGDANTNSVDLLVPQVSRARMLDGQGARRPRVMVQVASQQELVRKRGVSHGQRS